MRRLILICAAFLVSAPAAAQDPFSQDRFLGLVALPALCAEPCQGSENLLPLYKAPYQEEPAASISRETFFQANKNVQDQQSPYWPEAYEYERGLYGAVVYNMVKDSAYKIRIGGQDFWVRADDAGEYFPYPQILKGRLAYLENWDFVLWRAQGDMPELIPHPYRDDPLLAPKIPIRVLRQEIVDGKWWMQVAVYDRQPCGDTRPPFYMQGWVPAFKFDKTRTAWFFPQGC